MTRRTPTPPGKKLPKGGYGGGTRIGRKPLPTFPTTAAATPPGAASTGSGRVGPTTSSASHRGREIAYDVPDIPDWPDAAD